MQLGGLVLLHLLVAHDPDIDVIFVDPYHFPETIEFLDMLVDRWDLNLTVISPPTSVAEHEAEYGKQHALDPARCCELRKVWPADEALSRHDLWFTVVRTEQAGSRRHLELTEVHQLLTGQLINKANPLRDWAWINVETYAAENDIPRHPLYERGYTSIGCARARCRPSASATTVPGDGPMSRAGPNAGCTSAAPTGPIRSQSVHRPPHHVPGSPVTSVTMRTTYSPSRPIVASIVPPKNTTRIVSVVNPGTVMLPASEGTR